MIDIICQLGIALFGASAVVAVGLKGPKRRWGYVLGMLSQPFWFITAAVNQQWGIFMVSMVYCYGWSQGLYNFWILPWSARKTRDHE